jgi:hypothetical protein
MAQSNVFDTTNPGSAVSNAEDLTRGAYIIDTTITPVYAMLDKVRATNYFHEWTVDELDTPRADGVDFGSDATVKEDAFEGQERVGNYIQKERRVPAVTTEQERADAAGGVNFINAVEKSLKNLNRDTEKAILSDNTLNGSGPRPIAEGLAKTLSGSSDIFGANYQVPAGSRKDATAVTQDGVDDILRSIFDESGEMANVTVFGASGWMQDFNGATMNLSSSSEQYRTTVNLNGEDNELDFQIRVYQGQHGMIKVVDLNSKCLNDTVNKDEAYFINTDYACIAEYGPLENLSLPNNGAGKSSAISRWFTPVVKNPRAHGFWASTS